MSKRDEEQAKKSGTANRGESSDAEAQVTAAESAISEEMHKLTAERKELTDTLVRLQADFDNYRKRVERERHQDRQRGTESLVEHLLPVLDAFDRALASPSSGENSEYQKGFELIRKQLFDVLSKQGLHRIEAEGKPFDPHVHHAIERVETTEHREDTVIEELQAGYSYHGRVLRPAMVRVAAQPAAADEAKKSRVS